MSFSDKLKAYRELRGLTQADIAKELHISRQAISKWENRINEPDIMTIIKLCDILDISLDELLRDDIPLVQKLAYKERSFKKLLFSTIILGCIILLLLCTTSFSHISK